MDSVDIAAALTPEERYIAYARQSGQHWPRVAAPAQVGPRDGVVRVRSERIDITPGLGEALAGYSVDIRDRRAQGWLGCMYALVVLMDDGAGHRHAILSFDLHIGSRWVAERVAALTAASVGTSIERIFLAAAHTHAGPGGIYGSRFYDDSACSLTLPNGANLTYLEALSQRVATSLRALAAKIDAAPPGASTLEYRESVVWGVCWQRALAAHLANYGDITKMGEAKVQELAARTARTFAGALPAPGEIPRPDVRYLAVDARVRCLAWDLNGPAPSILAFVNVTPTRLGGEARVLGADVFGMAARWVEARLGPGARVSVAGSAHGDGFILDPEMLATDVADQRNELPDWPSIHENIASMARQAKRLGRGILTALGKEPAGKGPRKVVALAAAPLSARMDEATLAGAHLPVLGATLGDKMSVGIGMLKGNDLEAPSGFLKTLTDFAAASARPYPAKGTAWPRAYRFGWPRKSPDDTDPQSPKAECGPVNGLQTGSPGSMTPWVTSRVVTFARANGTPGLRLVGVPFEPTTMAAHEIETLVAAPGEEVLVACLAGDYLGYLTTEAEYRVQEYEGGSVWFGRDTLAWVKAQVAQLAAIPQAPEPGFQLVVRDTAWFGSPPSPRMVADATPGHAPSGAGPSAAITHLPAATPAMSDWVRLEGAWATKDRATPNGAPSAVNPSEPEFARPWVRLLIGDSPHGPFQPAMLDGGVPADDQCGWMLLRREGRIDPGGTQPFAIVWRWSLCAPRPQGWAGRWITFEIACTQDGVAMVNGPVPPVQVPG